MPRLRPFAAASIFSGAIFFLPILPAAILHAQENDLKPNESEIRRAVDRAAYEFSNEKMYRDQDRWVGRTVSFVGSFSLRTDILNKERSYEQIRGSSSEGDPVDVIALLDSPLKTPGGFGDNSPTITREQKVRVVGVVGKCREVLTRNGVVRVLPTIELLLVYALDDQSLSYPIWVSRSLRQP